MRLEPLHHQVPITDYSTVCFSTQSAKTQRGPPTHTYRMDCLFHWLLYHRQGCTLGEESKSKRHDIFVVFGCTRVRLLRGVCLWPTSRFRLPVPALWWGHIGAARWTRNPKMWRTVNTPILTCTPFCTPFCTVQHSFLHISAHTFPHSFWVCLHTFQHTILHTLKKRHKVCHTPFKGVQNTPFQRCASGRLTQTKGVLWL